MSAFRSLLLLAGVLSAPASAAVVPDVFRITVTGTATATWDHTGAPVPSGDCTTALRAQGASTARFRSRRATLVRFAGGRIKTVELRGLAGTVTFTGTNTLVETCDARQTTTPQPCAETTRRFTGGHTTLSSGGAGVVSVRAPRVGLRRNVCPRQPDEAVALPLGPAPGPLRVRTRTLANHGITRITVTASRTRTKVYEQPESGTLRQTVVWKLTLVRVRP
jgi:hypothetical protein